MKIRLVELEPISDKAGSSDLYLRMFGYLLHGANAERKERVLPETLRELLYGDSDPCAWCMGTGRAIGLRCYMCDGEGTVPSMRSLKRFIEHLAATRTELTMAHADVLRFMSDLGSIDPEEYGDVRRKMHDVGVRDMEETLDAELEGARKAAEEFGDMVENTRRAAEETEKIMRMNRTARRLVSYTITEQIISDPPPPPEPDPTCECGRSIVAWDDGGVGWCKRHAHARGLLQTPESDPTPDTTEPPAARGSGPQGAGRRDMTRPLRLVGGPLNDQLHAIERGEVRVVIKGWTYERRGHVLEFVEP